jgi:hypothetical protein
MLLRRAQSILLCANQLGWSHFVGMSRPSNSSNDPMPPTETRTDTDGAVPIPGEQHVIPFSNAPRQSVIGFDWRVVDHLITLDPQHPETHLAQGALRDENDVEMDCVFVYEGSSIDAASPTNANVVAELARSTPLYQQLFGEAAEPIMCWLREELQWADLDRRYLTCVRLKMKGYFIAWASEVDQFRHLVEFSDIDNAEDNEDFGEPPAGDLVFRPFF